MPTTSTYAWPYPALTDDPHIPADIQALAVAADTTVAGVDVRLVAAEASIAASAALIANAPRGWIAQTSPVAATSVTTTETIHASVTGNALATGRRYRVSYASGQTQSTVAGDLIQLRYRIASGASVTISGTFMRATAQHAEVASRNNPVCFNHVFTVASSGQWTVGISIQRTSGTGTVKLDYLVNVVEPLLVLEDIGV